jgi:hypothetical protein
MTFQYVVPSPDQPVQNRSLANRRACVRYKCGPATPGRVQFDGEEWQRAWVLDLSSSGAGLLLGRQVEKGRVITVFLKSNAQKTTFELPARVCHATRQLDGDWMVGCEFEAELTDDQLDALL